ncbi:MULTISPECIES: efflux RND transporter periplasmic adaptor subunit [unclassified Thioalkalivibrio]|uniref:efflux RND transporter periplasmic adaptor subunit n=1 Tax=unclassified Thioalkalivibrio TaxID=2621013 RepID=UPI00036DDB1B|nr:MULTISPECIES: efflux RND transporter periplasmic adaptor subunit [unclassified Thioalkalivibrio]
MPRPATLITALLFLLAAGILAWMLLGPEDDAASSGRPGGGETRPVAVAIAGIETRDLVERRRFTGSIEGADRIEITPRVGGRVAEVFVNLGDRVEPGDPLLQLDTEEFEQDVAQAAAELEVAEASLAEALASRDATRRELQRTRELRDQGIASRSELEAAETELALAQTRVTLAESQIRQRRSALRTREIQLSYTRIEAGTADSTRWVAERHVDPGTVISANDTALALVRLQPVRAILAVTEADYGRLSPSQGAQVYTAAYPDAGFAGTIARIAPEFRPGSRQARVEVEIPNERDQLRPGMFVEAAITLGERNAVLAIPRDAIIQREVGPTLFSVDRSGERPLARRHQAVTGVRDGDWVELLEPELPEGTEVVVLGQHLLADGTPLRLTDPRNVPGGNDTPESDTP